MGTDLERQAAALAVRMRAAIHAAVQAAHLLYRTVLETYLSIEHGLGRFIAETIQLVWLTRLILMTAVVFATPLAGIGYVFWGYYGAVVLGGAGLLIIVAAVFYFRPEKSDIDREVEKHEGFKQAVTKVFRYLLRTLTLIATVITVLYFLLSGAGALQGPLMRRLFDTVTIQNNCRADAHADVLYKAPLGGWHIRGSWKIPANGFERLPIYSNGSTVGIHIRYEGSMIPRTDVGGLRIESQDARFYAVSTIKIPEDSVFDVVVPEGGRSLSVGRDALFTLYVTGTKRADLRYMGYCKNEPQPEVTVPTKKPAKKSQLSRAK